MTLDAPTDAALLFALVRQKLCAGLDAATALATTVADVSAAAPGSRLNLLLTDGRQITATACGHSLSIRDGDGTVVASEPLDDDPAWRPVPDGSLVVATTATVDVRPLSTVGVSLRWKCITTRSSPRATCARTYGPG